MAQIAALQAHNVLNVTPATQQPKLNDNTISQAEKKESEKYKIRDIYTVYKKILLK